MKRCIFFFSVFLATVAVSAQSFNGAIDFKYYKGSDTLNNVYLVKDQVVKLVQYGKKSGTIEGGFIFDLTNHNIRWINPKRKVWGDHKSETPALIKGKCEVSKGNQTKTIQGFKCQEYIVKNPDENTSITYWICTEKFNFFIPVLQLWNRKDKQSVYFNQITGLPQGAMPLLSEEKQINDGKVLTRLEVVKIANKSLDEASVSVPSDFTKFDK
ncbi:MAG: hypothetical protein IPM51_14775 [Sphingobacteriaceae bacterium]|nr:hypothetical protein [Sphingobacteriaceae bacterium]